MLLDNKELEVAEKKLSWVPATGSGKSMNNLETSEAGQGSEIDFVPVWRSK